MYRPSHNNLKLGINAFYYDVLPSLKPSIVKGCRVCCHMKTSVLPNESKILQAKEFFQDKNKITLTKNLHRKKLMVPAIQYPNEQETEVTGLPSYKANVRNEELKQNINLCEDVQSLIWFYSQNETQLEKQHYILFIKKLEEILPNNKESVASLLKMKEFQRICHYIWKLCSTLEVREVLQLYKYFLDIGIPTNVLLIQSLLQMMRHQINLFDIYDLLFLNRMLVKTSPCKLKAALEIAIPKVLENHIKIYISPKLQVHELLQLLDVCIKGEVMGTEKILFLIYHKKLQDLFHQDSPYYYNNLVSLIWNVLDIYLLRDNKSKIIKPSKDIEIIIDVLLNNTIEELVKNDGLKSISKEQILALMNKLLKVYNNGYVIASSELFLRNVSKVAKKWDINLMSTMIAYQMRMHYVDDKLLAKTTDLLLQGPKHVDFTSITILPLLSAVAAAGDPNQRFKPEFISTLLNQPQNPTPENNIDFPWLKLSLNLMSLKYFPEKLLNVILKEDFLDRYLQFRSYSSFEYMDLLRIHRSIESFWSNSTVAVPEQVLEKAIDIQRSSIPTPLLTSALKLAVGENNIISNIVTPNLSFIDHLIFLDDQRNPVPFQSQQNCSPNPIELSSILPATNMHPKYRLSLMEVPDSWICRPKRIIRGHFKLELDLIKKELDEYFSSSTILLPILEEELKALDGNELPTYLRDKINNCL